MKIDFSQEEITVLIKILGNIQIPLDQTESPGVKLLTNINKKVRKAVKFKLVKRNTNDR